MLDGQVLADLIQQSKAELLALAVPTTEEPGNSLTTPTGQQSKAEQGEGQEILTTPTCTKLGDSQESSELGDGATNLSMELGDSREGPLTAPPSSDPLREGENFEELTTQTEYNV